MNKPQYNALYRAIVETIGNNPGISARTIRAKLPDANAERVRIALADLTMKNTIRSGYKGKETVYYLRNPNTSAQHVVRHVGSRQFAVVRISVKNGKRAEETLSIHGRLENAANEAFELNKAAPAKIRNRAQPTYGARYHE